MQGDKTALQFNNGLYVDPANGDIYSVESDTGDKMERFPREASGDVNPISILHTPHRVYNMAADEVKQELFLTVEFQAEVLAYRKGAAGEERPLRTIVGDEHRPRRPARHRRGREGPADVRQHLGPSQRLSSSAARASTFRRPSRFMRWMPTATCQPLRVITGDKTQLDWPGGMKFNPDNGDLYVANDIGQSVLVFANAPNSQGDVAPTRVIHGPSTRLRNPTGVALDLKNKEVWVSNLGNSSATVYPLMANGDVPPLRIIRSAEESKRGLNFGRTPGGHLRSHPPGNPGTELSEPSANRGLRQVGESKTHRLSGPSKVRNRFSAAPCMTSPLTPFTMRSSSPVLWLREFSPSAEQPVERKRLCASSRETKLKSEP